MPVWGKEEILLCWEETFASFLPRVWFFLTGGSVVATVGGARILLLCRFWVVFPQLGLQRQQICLKIGPSRSPKPGWVGGGER